MRHQHTTSIQLFPSKVSYKDKVVFMFKRNSLIFKFYYLLSAVRYWYNFWASPFTIFFCCLHTWMIDYSKVLFHSLFTLKISSILFPWVLIAKKVSILTFVSLIILLTHCIWPILKFPFFKFLYYLNSRVHANLYTF